MLALNNGMPRQGQRSKVPSLAIIAQPPAIWTNSTNWLTWPRSSIFILIYLHIWCWDHWGFWSKSWSIDVEIEIGLWRRKRWRIYFGEQNLPTLLWLYFSAVFLCCISQPYFSAVFLRDWNWTFEEKETTPIDVGGQNLPTPSSSGDFGLQVG